MTEHEGLMPDFSEAVAFDDSQIPPGIYTVRVDSFQNKASKKDNTPYLQWKLVIFGATEELARQNNRPVYLSTMLKGPGAGILKQFLTTCLGELPSDWSPGWQNQCIGKELQVTLTKNIKPDGTEGFPNVRGMKALEH